MTSLIQQQIELEKQAGQDGIDRYDKILQKQYDPKKESALLPPDIMILKNSIEPFSKAIEEFRDNKKRGQKSHVKTVFKRTFTFKDRNGNAKEQQIKPIELAFITINTILHSKDRIGLPVQSMGRLIGIAVEEHLDFKYFESEAPGYVHIIKEAQRTSNANHKRKVVRASETRLGCTKENWSEDFKFDVGYRLMCLLIESTGIIKMTNGKTKNGNACKTVHWHPDVEKKIEQGHDKFKMLSPVHKPMIAPPVEWDDMKGGGYYVNELDLIKHKSDSKKQGIQKPDQQVFDAINRVQHTEWQINAGILSVAQELANKNGSKLGVISSIYDEEMPRHPSNEPDFPDYADEKQYHAAFEQWKNNNLERFKSWKKQMTHYHDRCVADKSKWTFQSMVIQQAQQVKDYDKIYFPWVMDFRGRMYPVSTALSPQGEDLSKGLLQFASGVALGEHGAFWLAVHGANTWGNDKVSLQERYKWVLENERNIVDSGEYPLEGNQMWLDADEPWQFLAFCMEWAEYVRSGKSREHRSKLCVAVDGSCNGLQHYSALMRDDEGAAVCNLKTLPERKDIYIEVAERVADEVAKEAQSESKEAWIAQMWDGLITRTLVKRNVMTVPYGVTMRGMSDQIIAELKHINDSDYNMLQMEAYKAGSYLGKKVYKAIKEVVTSAITGMDWIKECAKVFNETGQGIRWTTPVGMHVYMHKLKTQKKRIETQTGSAVVKLSFKKTTDKLNTKKQINGIAPNVIHSIDAAHLMMTVNACAEKHNICDFGMVHDSFGCHAGKMQDMYHELRKQFRDLYSRDLLSELREQWKAQLPEKYAEKLPEVPEYGTYSIEEVLGSEYFFA